MARPSPKQDAVAKAMWDMYRTAGIVAPSVAEIYENLNTDDFATRQHVSAIIIGMIKKGTVIEVGVRPRSTNSGGRQEVNIYSLTEIVELATAPNAKGPEPHISEPEISAEEIKSSPNKQAALEAIANAADSGPAAKPTVTLINDGAPIEPGNVIKGKVAHVNRPPLQILLTKEEFERREAQRKAAAGNDQSSAEKNAMGETVTSIPASRFAHYDSNQASGKLTGERRPGENAAKRMIAESREAVNEMVEHIRNTEGDSTMTVGAPRKGTPEYTIAERDKRIDRLEKLLEMAISEITKANREGLAKQEAAFASFNNALDQHKNEIAKEFAKDVNHTEEVLTKFMEKVNESFDAQIAVGRDVVQTFLTMKEINTRNNSAHDTAVKMMAEFVMASNNVRLMTSTAYMDGWNEGVKQGREEATIEKIDEKLWSEAEKVAKKLGIMSTQGE